MSATFPTTRWSLVLRAGRRDDSQAQAALSTLCEAYWFPLYAYARRCGIREDDARDLVQAYFVQLIEKRFLDSVRPARGRFRAFLLHTLKHFISNERARAATQQRGGTALHLPLDLENAESRFATALTDGRTPEEDFNRNWAVSVVDRVLDGLQSDARKKSREAEFDRLRVFLTERQERGDYANVARELGLTEGAVKVAVHRLRKRFGQALCREIAETVDDPEEVEDEIRYLFNALTR